MTAREKTHRSDRAEVAEQRFAIPVVLAALASVPAMFLTTLGGTAEPVGQTVNYAPLVVLTAETAVLFWLAEDRLGWLRRRWWLVAIAIVSIPAVLFAVGPAQALRLVRSVGALRVIRVGRIIKAGRILRDRMGLTGPFRTALVVVVTLLSAAFVAIVLADPSSQSRQFAEQVVEVVGATGVVAAGLIVAGATWVVWRYRERATGDGSDRRSEP